MAITFTVKSTKEYLGFTDYMKYYNDEILKSMIVPEYALNQDEVRAVTAQLRGEMSGQPLKMLARMNEYIKSLVGSFSCKTVRYDQNPGVYDASLTALRRLGLKAAPSVYSYDAKNEYKYNSMAVGYGNNINIFLSRHLLEESLYTGSQRLFVIGHELGHNQCNCTAYGLLGRKKDKRTNRFEEYTADRAGLIACQDLEGAVVCLIKIILGARLEGINPQEADQKAHEQARELLDKKILVGELERDEGTHPCLQRRIYALKVFAGSEMYYRWSGREAPVDAFSDEMLNTKMEFCIR